MNPHPCYCHLIWPIGAFAMMVILLTINYFAKWIKKKTVVDEPSLAVVFVFACLIWPATLILGFAILLVWFIIKYCVPK